MNKRKVVKLLESNNFRMTRTAAALNCTYNELREYVAENLDLGAMKVEARKKASSFVKSGKSVAETAKKFGVGVANVRESCKMFGVKPAPHTEPTALGIVDSILSGMTFSEAAREHGVSRQRVSSVVAKLKSADVVKDFNTLRTDLKKALAKAASKK